MKLGKRNLLMILFYIVLVVSIIAVTFAAFTYNTNKVISTKTGFYEAVVNGSTSISTTGLTPINYSGTISNSQLSSVSDKIFVSSFTVIGSANNSNDKHPIYDVALTNINFDDNLLNQYLKWELIKNNTVIASGNFSTVTNGNRFVLTNLQQDLVSSGGTADSYKFVMWIDGNFANGFDQTSMMSKSFSANIDIEVYVESKVSQR